MDELPDLQSDADVDALMARLRARIDSGPPARPAIEAATPPVSLGDGIGELLAAQDAFAAAIVRAMSLIADTLEEVAAEDRGGAAARNGARQRTAPRRMP